MTARIPILNRARDVVVIYSYDGKQWTLRATEDQYYDALKSIRAAIANGIGLSQVKYRTDVGYVRGWKGVWGTLNALDAVLPPIGLWVDWNHIELSEND